MATSVFTVTLTPFKNNYQTFFNDNLDMLLFLYFFMFCVYFSLVKMVFWMCKITKELPNLAQLNMQFEEISVVLIRQRTMKHLNFSMQLFLQLQSQIGVFIMTTLELVSEMNLRSQITFEKNF